MARKKPVDDALTVLFLILVAVIGFVYEFIRSNTIIFVLSLTVLSIIMISLFIMYRQYIRRRAEAAISDALDEHYETLARRRLHLCKRDAYGYIDDTSWRKELDDFVRKRVLPQAGNTRLDLAGIIDDIVAPRSEEIANSNPNFESASPIEFEHWCALKLRQQGWIANTTKGSGDQGADVLAEKNGVKLVLQCKLYSKPVGNKAVQEVYTAKAHYGMDYAAAVTGQQYTSAAQSAANTTGVLLLHFTDLDRVDQIIGLPGTQPMYSQQKPIT